MAQTADLMGVGIPAAPASMLGMTPAAVTCAGTSSTTATAITTKISNLTAASSQTGAILPAVGTAPAYLGALFVCGCTSSTSAVVYPPSGATINGATSLTIAQNKAALIAYISTTVLFSVLTA